MKDKRHTQLQRIKINEKIIGTIWNVLKKQGEEISKINLLLKELSDNNKKKD
jgi:hypothetical protein|tara:strand:+ start:414 stop:569 length:156 start_codon:yes stop_codon:yes gene_type:complete